MYLECQKMDVWPSFHQPLEGRTSEKLDFYISCLQWRFCQNKWEGKAHRIDRNRGSSWKFLMGLLPGSIRPVREIHSAAWDRVCLHTKQARLNIPCQGCEVIISTFSSFISTLRILKHVDICRNPLYVTQSESPSKALKHQVEDGACTVLRRALRQIHIYSRQYDDHRWGLRSARITNSAKELCNASQRNIALRNIETSLSLVLYLWKCETC